MPVKPNAFPKDATATIGLETTLWHAGDNLRNNMDAADHNHVVHDLTQTLLRGEEQREAIRRPNSSNSIL